MIVLLTKLIQNPGRCIDYNLGIDTLPYYQIKRRHHTAND